MIVAGLFFLKASNLARSSALRARAALRRPSGLAQPLWQFVAGGSRRRSAFAGVLTAAGVVFFAYSGFEAVANLGEETENPGRTCRAG